MNRSSLIWAVMLVLSLAATHHVKGQDNSPEPTAESVNSEEALEILSGSTRLIEAAPAFLVKGKSGGELLLGNGQLVESGTTFTAIFKRPSQLKLLLKSRRGHKTTMIFDGETITLTSIFQGKQIYATAPQPGDVNDSLDFVFNQAGSPRELEHFLSPKWTQSLNMLRPAVVYVGKSAIDGVWCDHLAIQSDTNDVQAWIARRGEPVPWRILITHREEPLQPRYWLQFDEWDFSPDITESTFKFTPPEGAIKFQYFQN